MYQDILIASLDNFGRGVARINNKVVFIKNALPGEIVDIKITVDKKNYSEALVTNYKKTSPKRIASKCPYFNECGGCHLLFYHYEDTLDFKLTKVQNLLLKNKISVPDISIISNPLDFNYRNKIKLKINAGNIGFYKEDTHELVPINECLIANDCLNKVIKNYKLLNLENATLTIRCNTNNEVLLIIDALDPNYNIEIEKLKKEIKLVGIVYNDKTIYGNNFYYERLHNFLFKVSYDSFFQVNPYITEKLFDLILNHISPNSKVLDLYSGVGTLSLLSSQKAQAVYSIEIVPNAVLNGLFNAKINKIDNVKFLLGDVSKLINKLNFDFDTLIVDPPRKGLDKNTINFIQSKLPSKIIYISCDVSTLIRDLNVLKAKYTIKEYKILDMFSYTYHLESLCILNLKPENF